MIVKTQDEIDTLRECGHRLAKILDKVVKAVKPGVSAKDLDRLAESLILSQGGEPVFKGYKIKEEKRAYPASLCVSINDEIVHGIPLEKKIIKEGDIVGLDIGMKWPSAKIPNPKSQIPNDLFRHSEAEGRRISEGLITDMAVTVGVGKISQEAEKLLRSTKESLGIGISILRPGVKLGDLGFIIRKHLEKNNLSIIRDLCGHGVGKELHEEPMVLNYGKKGTGLELREGMVIAIEPMASLGDWKIKVDSDGWTIRTADKSLAAHFEHTVVIIKNGAEVLTKIK
ncbi:MAG: type I methionyl aminopeptidase [Candidatus Sungbacteria bacterium RIFCSPLOWO2_12_FULL_41_11]|uniref:Methionine aminopeptidase n=1 Tax=Candidatus Sungbacteria bacterium RIFCSPLOWO2_12_FULL_41_11 TaxID=1802286 RepID=A0A1G2LQQ1_9BACT|nr:MAG: Methionine aminopeptidase [Parcubacteria group bacterium GW2011_GWA2_42_14]OGZ98412.1 MAG: type I methionyl aminopeptidase [Candidatus Sungbacteria bacterium RIFCSPHIGHO2_02_FULL_41_12b]OHA13936.1 MAG: type I methionyl aminopeptidase [Candidatus Sungbacteria bacterium RIFCSPLOWO2_12_FULL_41_11]